MIIFMSLDRGMRCFERRNRIKTKWVLWSHLTFMNLAIFVDDNKRIKELCNFLICEAIQTGINTFKSVKNIENQGFDNAVAVW